MTKPRLPFQYLLPFILAGLIVSSALQLRACTQNPIHRSHPNPTHEVKP